MRLTFILFFSGLLSISGFLKTHAQDVHFTQYYNTPMLQNVANTALMSDRDFRLSGIYRNQWAAIPAPFTTFHAAAEFQTLRNDQFTNWLGIGAYAISDKAGDGELAMTSYGLNLAYHLMLNESSILSFGLGGSLVTRGIDFTKMSFDTQWDGFTFNKELPNGETRMYEKANYANVSAGINLSFFPSENMYYKIGVGMTHINRPKVSLLGGNTNELGFRPMATIDAILIADGGWRVAPSAYFTFMQQATNIIGGATVSKDFKSSDDMTGYIFTGVYYRFNESVISTVGIEWNDVKITASYDFTVSPLAKANSGNGAFEISLVFQGLYGRDSGIQGKSPWACPRF